ncbi:phosphate/phosphite/phosphonate ABC transporter substrate-binding protein [Roseateles koreensis]|uniref:PhnD/SsuA/transferrin family substrate-binding protein n=1 Tax=Roseateles koreensis TaxID=2987526 RepID=A0ABT5KT03_9BURK|nr:PhnD/SsuA/transferrin family substrate-binding protein [Roseateles koreensis]MDC8785956.1 PhnD/SsuA/transferrin family substrate-binding protein [Roseateles koreensis]
MSADARIDREASTMNHRCETGQKLRAGWVLLRAVVGLFCGWLTVTAVAAAEYRFSPVNQSNISTAAAYWNPIVAYVSEKSGVKLSLKIGRTSADTTSYVLAQEVEFVFSNHLFSPDREALGWKVFGRRNTPAVRGQLVVLADSPISNVAELEGKDIGFPGPEAFLAYKLPYGYLLNQKINARPVFGGNMDGAFAQLISGKVTAVGANSQLVEAYTKRENKYFRVLWSSEPMFDLALMASSKVPEKEVEAVARAFLGMQKDPHGRAILAQVNQLIGLAPDIHFIAADSKDYASYRRFYQTAPVQVR